MSPNKKNQQTIDCRSMIEQKQKYSNAIEKQSIQPPPSVAMNGSGFLGINRDISVKHLVSTVFRLHVACRDFSLCFTPAKMCSFSVVALEI